MKSILLNTSFRSHALVGAATGLWLVLFLVLIAPFDVGELPFIIRLQLLPPYGFIFLGCYMAAVVVQNLIHDRISEWHIGWEAFIIGLTYVLTLFANYVYYKTPLVNGVYDLGQFTLEIYLPILVIFSIVLILGRWYISRPQGIEVAMTSSKLMLKGDNKDDILQIAMEDIVCISSAQNYVEVNYRHQSQPQKKLLRTTLKKIMDQVPSLIQVHRSHLVNPAHLTRWNDANTILVGTRSVPVSKGFKKALQEHLDSVPNTDPFVPKA